MRYLWICLALSFGLASAAEAQTTGTPSSRLGWDQQNASAAEAESFTYRYYPDGATVGTVLTGVTCVAGTPTVCSAPFPAFTPGNHSLTLTASNAAGESLPSAPLSFTFVVVPTAPANLRILE